MNKDKINVSPKELRRQRERKQRRKDIISVAEKFFVNEGYTLTTIDKVVHEAGFSKATFYNYFESKEDLFLAVVAVAFDKLYQTLTDFLNRSNTKYELRSLGEAYLVFIENYPDYASLFNSGELSLAVRRLIIKEQTSQPLTESEAEFRSYQLKIQELMTNVIIATMKNTKVQRKVDPLSVIIALSTLGQSIQELVLRGKRSNQPDKSREYLSVLFTIIDSGLKHYGE